MENCPYCDAPGSYRESTDGSCYVCGMMLPNLSGQNAPSVATAVMGHAHKPDNESPEPGKTPGRDEPTIVVEPSRSTPTVFMEASGPPAIDLIHPRNLSPEYARRVTAAWQVTKSPFKNPLETINSNTAAQAAADNLLIGTRTVSRSEDEGRADYKLNEVIGEGAMGTVWSARQGSLDREVAIKIPKPSSGDASFGRQLFISEVVVTGQLDHPNIVPIYDLARDESGQLFYAMKRVEGRSWDTCMHEEGRTRHDNVEILMKVCDAVRFAHNRKVIHRDIKPQNIMVGKFGEVSVMDWGIALKLPEGTQIPGMAKISPSGTPAYMAPEMATGNANEIGWHTDVYLLGAVLYEIITGEPPHPAPPATNDVFVQQKACLLIAARNVITPAKETGELIDIAYKAMATDVYDRYPTVDEFQESIRSYFEHAESIALTERGDAHLTNAREARNGVYEDFAKARFAFDEAIQLWPENNRARHGLSEATHDYAGSALERGDYALGLSLLRDDDAAHTELAKQLRSAKRRQERSRSVATWSAVAAACFLIGGFVVSSYYWHSASLAKDVAESAEKKAKEDRDKAVVAQKNEAAQRKKADESKDAAKASESTALAAKDAAEVERKKADAAKDAAKESEAAAIAAKKAEEMERKKAVAAKEQVQQASYRSEIGLAAEELRRNAFSSAQLILEGQTKNHTQAALHTWERRYLKYIAQEPSIIPFEVGGAAKVEAVALSSDQKCLAASTDDGHLHVWLRPDPSKPALKIQSPIVNSKSEPITSLAISKDGQLVGAFGNEVHFWQLPKGDRGLTEVGKPLIYSSKIPSRIVSIALSAKGDKVLAGTSDSKAQLWSLATPDKAPQSFLGHLSGPVWQASFSPDDKLVVTAGDDESIRVWDSNDGKELRKFEGHVGPVYAVAFSPDGSHIVSGGRDRQLLVWDLQAPSTMKTRTEAVHQKLATTQETDHDENIHQLGVHSAAIHCLAFAPNGKTLFSGSDDNSLRVWDVSRGWQHLPPKVSLRGHGGWVRACVAAADGQHILSGSYDGKALLWDWSNYAFPRVLKPDSNTAVRFASAAASPDAQWIATAGEDGTITMWNMKDLRNPVALKLEEGHAWQATTGVYFHEGSRLLTAGGDNSAVVWDAKSGVQLFRLGGWKEANGTGWRGVGAASFDGQSIATGSSDKAILAKLWDSESGNLKYSLTLPPNVHVEEPAEAAAIAFAPDNQTVFVGAQSGHGYLFRMKDGSFLHEVIGHNKKINAATFLPKNGHLLTASSDHSVIEWDLGSGTDEPRQVQSLPHQDRVVAMDKSSDGNLLVTVADSLNDDTVLRLWDLKAGKVVRSMTLAQLVDWRSVSGTEVRPDTQDVNKINQLPAVRSVAFNSDQQHALVTLYDPKDLKYRVGTWEWTNTQPTVRWIYTGLRDTSMAVYSPNQKGSILTVGGRGARVRLVDSKRVISNLRPQSHVQSVAFSPKSNLFASVGADASVKLWRLDGSKKTWIQAGNFVGQSGLINSVAFHPTQDDLLLTAGDDGSSLWRKGPDGWKESMLTVDKAGAGPCQQAIFSMPDANGAVEIFTAADKSVNRWRLDGKLLDTTKVDQLVGCLAISTDRDSKWIVGGVGGDAWVWKRGELKSGPVQKLAGHSADVTAVAFSKDGERLFTAGRDFHVKLWDVNAWDAAGAEQSTSRELLTLEQHTDSVVSLALFPSKDFPALLSAGADGQAILWPSVDWH